MKLPSKPIKYITLELFHNKAIKVVSTIKETGSAWERQGAPGNAMEHQGGAAKGAPGSTLERQEQGGAIMNVAFCTDAFPSPLLD